MDTELKRWVLRRDWNRVRDSDSRRYWGREFQSFVAATEKALSPKLRSLASGMESKPAEVDLRDRGGW